MSVIRTLALAVSLVVCSLFGFSPAHAQLDVDISVDVEPPPLPVYDQPPIPEPGYLWVPGYWAWDDDTGYYWVPGTWVQPPEPELLWTPGYWGWDDGVYVFHAGYWGPQIGFYGGVAYGFGYDGVGYEGGYWRGGAFYYNRSVNNFGGVRITNVYNKTVVVNNVDQCQLQWRRRTARQRGRRPNKSPPAISGTSRRPPSKRATPKRRRKIRRCRSTIITATRRSRPPRMPGSSEARA